MAKAKKSASAKTTSTELVVPETHEGQISLQVALQTDQIMAIFRSGAKSLVNKELAKCRAEIDKLDKQRKELADKLSDTVATRVKKAATGPADEMTLALAAFGHKVEYELEMPGNPRTKTKALEVRVVFRQRTLASENVCSVPFTVKTTAGMLTTAKKIEAVGEAIEVIKNQQLAWHKRLSKVPELEETITGELAASQAAKTVEGREMIEIIGNNITQRIMNIPV